MARPWRTTAKGRAVVSLQSRLQDLRPEAAKVLTLDIETSPATALGFSLKPDYISPNQVLEHSRVLCFAAKWQHEKQVLFYDERQGRKAMVEAAWRLLDEADVVVGYNHVRFDIPHLHREMVELGYGPPSPAVDVDLLTEVRKHFRFMSNKLGAVLDCLGLDAKEDPGGFDTWKGVLAGDEAAWKRMAHYCKADVQVTENLLTYLQPWLRLPHAGLFTGDLHGCYSCGAQTLTPDGIARTRTTAYLRLVCACGAHNRVMTDGTTRRA